MEYVPQRVSFRFNLFEETFYKLKSPVKPVFQILSAPKKSSRPRQLIQTVVPNQNEDFTDTIPPKFIESPEISVIDVNPACMFYESSISRKTSFAVAEIVPVSSNTRVTESIIECLSCHKNLQKPDIASSFGYLCSSCTKDLKPVNGKLKRIGTKKTPVVTRINNKNHQCLVCQTTDSTLWRKNKFGTTICNACKLYFDRNKIARPGHLFQRPIRSRKRLKQFQFINRYSSLSDCFDVLRRSVSAHSTNLMDQSCEVPEIPIPRSATMPLQSFENILFHTNPVSRNY
ncbi:hypothetical protein GJ496_003571 [Pomphorhynchus laevis]|nr:hypothetical protein GJ496_003571 [Pomphorhynchus laevis]